MNPLAGFMGTAMQMTQSAVSGAVSRITGSGATADASAEESAPSAAEIKVSMFVRRTLLAVAPRLHHRNFCVTSPWMGLDVLGWGL